MVIGILINSDLPNGVPRHIILISHTMNLAPVIEIVLLKRHFYVNVSAVGVLTLPGLVMIRLSAHR